jgi:hypothetical protein
MIDDDDSDGGGGVDGDDTVKMLSECNLQALPGLVVGRFHVEIHSLYQGLGT